MKSSHIYAILIADGGGGGEFQGLIFTAYGSICQYAPLNNKILQKLQYFNLIVRQSVPSNCRVSVLAPPPAIPFPSSL